MWNDVHELRDFYATGLGLTARRLIRHRLRALWPRLSGERVLGFGYALPYLGLWQGEAERTVALMPAEQGVVHWPGERANATVLTDEKHWPLPDRGFDRVLLIHAVESSEALRAMLRETWRVLADGGRVIVVVPSRRSLWARNERTPFGQGRPFTVQQITRLLRDSMFSPLRTESALILPPFRSRFVQAWAPAWDRVGRTWLTFLAGVTLTEASKQVYGTQPLPARALRRRVLPAPALARPAARRRPPV